MANQNDSFIDEVTEDLRRDRLFAALRRYGWIMLVVILAIVAGTAWREYSQRREAADAQAFGDALLAAEASADPAAAIAALPPGRHPQRAALTGLLAAAQQLAAGQTDAAAASLSAVADNTAAPQAERDLARLKLMLMQDGKMDAAARDAVLADLSAPGRPFRLLALEQKAVALIEAGRKDDAITLIRQIQKEQGLSQNQARRLGETLTVLGADAAPDATAATPAMN